MVFCSTFKLELEQVTVSSLVEILLLNSFVNKLMQLVPKAQQHKSEPKQVSSNRGNKHKYILRIIDYENRSVCTAHSCEVLLRYPTCSLECGNKSMDSIWTYATTSLAVHGNRI